MHGPTSHVYYSQRLKLHYVDWGNPDAAPLLLVHGGRDHCRNWDWVADNLRKDYHIIAPDLRGHGDSEWLIGGGYYLIDYVYDVAHLIFQKKMAPVTIIGHSLGGSISLLYTGLHPDKVNKLIAIEGLGPSPQMIKEFGKQGTSDRLIDWMSGLRNLSGRSPRKYKSLEDAFQRMQTENPHLSAERARHLTIHGSTQNEDGTFSWKFDNYVRAFPPLGLPIAETVKIHGAIKCPTLLIRGTESWASDPEEDGRLQHFSNASVANIENAGHWSHHDQLDEFMQITRSFLA